MNKTCELSADNTKEIEFAIEDNFLISGGATNSLELFFTSPDDNVVYEISNVKVYFGRKVENSLTNKELSFNMKSKNGGK